MSFELLEQLDEKIKQAVETIQLQQLEIDELKEKNEGANNQLNSLNEERTLLQGENERLQHELSNWQERVRSVLGRIENL